MPFNELETQKIKNAVEAIFMAKRPPVHIRKQLDLGYRIDKQNLFLFEVRPHWQDASQVLENEIAKLTYVKSKQEWKLYWMRQDLKWHRYEPAQDLTKLDDLLTEVIRDEFGCFFG